MVVDVALDQERVEKVINETHVYDLFNTSASDLPFSLLEHLAMVLSKCWACRLREEFPDRRFAFGYASEPREYGPTITFWSIG